LLPLLSVAMLPLVWFGMTILARFQLVSLLLYAVLLAVALGISLTGPDQGRDWLNFTPGDAPPPAVAMLAAIGTMNGIVVIVALQSADYARYIRRAELRLGVLFVGVAFPAFCFGFAGLLGLWFSTRYSETNPGLFFVTILGGWGTLLAFATQLRINAANMYSGALALVNSCRQLANLRLSRHLLLLFFCATVCALLELDVIAHLDVVVNVLGMFTACFTFLLIADFYLVRPIGSHQDAAPEPAWRWPAVLSLALATVAGCLLESGVGGPLWAFAASLVAGLIQVVGYLAISALARSAMFAGRSAAGVTAPLE
jgi:purine-cytosine permease-like protein